MNHEAGFPPKSEQWLSSLFDALPLILFVVDDRFRVLYLNSSGREFLSTAQNVVFMKQSGSVLRCLHAGPETGGCGKTEACQSCVIRQAMHEAVRGQRVHRRQARLRIRGEGKETEAHYLVTAAPFSAGGEPAALVMLEDVSQLVRLESLLPICASCKKIRDEHGQWHNLEQYLESRVEVEFTHGMCPQCIQKWYPDEG